MPDITIDCLVCEGTGSVPTFADHSSADNEHWTTDASVTCDACGGTGRALCAACGDQPATEIGAERLLCAACNTEERHGEFERRARDAKVARLMAVLPPATTSAQIAQIADWLAELAPADRDVIAARAGCRRPPSEKTWALLVAAARARKPRLAVLAGGRS